MIGKKALVVMSLGMAAALGSCRTAPPSVQEAPGGAPLGGAAERSIQQGFDWLIPNRIPRYEWFNLNYHRISGCQQAGNQQIRFKTLTVSGDRAQWNLLANTVVASCVDTLKPPRMGWYAYDLPVGQNLMVMFKNVSSGDSGYMIIRNEPTGWFVQTPSAGPYLLEPGRLRSFTWSTGGQTILMGARNPAGTRSWLTGQRGILFAFGLQ